MAGDKVESIILAVAKKMDCSQALVSNNLDLRATRLSGLRGATGSDFAKVSGLRGTTGGDNFDRVSGLRGTKGGGGFEASDRARAIPVSFRILSRVVIRVGPVDTCLRMDTVDEPARFV